MDKCINQVFNPETVVVSHDHGDCTICNHHPDNKMCSGYIPVDITVYHLNVKDDDSQASSAIPSSDIRTIFG